MKTKAIVLTMGLCLIALAAVAQKPMDQPSEKSIKITQGPSVTNDNGTSATLTWTTDKTAANHVKYRIGGGAWKSSFQPGGSTNHSLQLTGLQPGQNVEWQILTRDGDVRTSGQFQAGSGGGTTAAAPGAPAPPSAGTSAHAPLLRADNAQTGQHLYTTNQSELTSVQGQGWTGVGTVGYISTTQAPGTTALYRLAGGNGDHFYTTDANEKNSLVAQGWRDEGVVGYVATSQQPGTLPLHRMVSTKTGMHFYSANAHEVVEATTHQGYREEGVTGYIWTQ
jgi:uncharacterized protein DUF5648